VSLSHSLRLWINEPDSDEWAAFQILAYSNLGALVENTLRVFLSVHYTTYRNDAAVIVRKGLIQDPDEATFDRLRDFFKKRIWRDDTTDDWDSWICRIQYRRNAIHAFKDRDIGTHGELIEDVREYLRFLRRVDGQLPYPD
jgi:hypothetical protein